MLRADDYSWQASYNSDPLFFLRREKGRPDLVTDCLLGQLNSEHASELLAEFLHVTGPQISSRLIFSKISDRLTDHSVSVAQHDQISKVARSALGALGVGVSDIQLEPNGSEWDTIVCLCT